MTFVPAGFDPPAGLDGEGFVLEPLGPEHNDADYAAWTSSMQHIRDTPGYAGRSWPREMTLEQNRDDLVRHRRDFEARQGFTYTVLDPADQDVIGCVYIYPTRPAQDGVAHVESWMRADRAWLDVPLHDAVRAWLERDWPFHRIDYAERLNR